MHASSTARLHCWLLGKQKLARSCGGAGRALPGVGPLGVPESTTLRRLTQRLVGTLQGELRIAHCGGFHAAPFNVLVKAVNLVATLLGHPVHWDTETVCSTPHA